MILKDSTLPSIIRCSIEALRKIKKTSLKCYWFFIRPWRLKLRMRKIASRKCLKKIATMKKIEGNLVESVFLWNLEILSILGVGISHSIWIINSLNRLMQVTKTNNYLHSNKTINKHTKINILQKTKKRTKCFFFSTATTQAYNHKPINSFYQTAIMNTKRF